MLEILAIRGSHNIYINKFIKSLSIPSDCNIDINHSVYFTTAEKHSCHLSLLPLKRLRSSTLEPAQGSYRRMVV